ncbi:hypothetical protein K470DRAFT_254700 [Piedraia hortae CBS 480.64]|uniref:Uncharacterized protein n=1 Tax=Piedraia hortae CBS 480.64 TaxID=1314780 RepID=A0A6A7C9C2_9PEZI|nr:hypothetical protein K470DRAFT_254700 [Piedraia hortae CBS 480.64]
MASPRDRSGRRRSLSRPASRLFASSPPSPEGLDAPRRRSRLDVVSSLRSRRHPGGPPGALQETQNAEDIQHAQQTVRVKDRETSMRREGVDGGYLVTMGIYPGREDFDKCAVRQLQIERRIAPFWLGLEDDSSGMSDERIIQAVRSRVPAKERPFSEDPESEEPMSRAPSRQMTTASPADSRFRFSRWVKNLLPGPKSNSRPQRQSSWPSSLSPCREIQLTCNPLVDGIPIEVYLYKETIECEICFHYYPRFMNQALCCGKMICSECFVQIKRSKPHPIHGGDHHDAPFAEDEADNLVSDPANCPFCMSQNFCISYNPPPFRQGLIYASDPFFKAGPSQPTMSTNKLQKGPLRYPETTVVTSDQIRPEWEKNLAQAKVEARRRSAAATALHQKRYGSISGSSTGGVTSTGLDTSHRRDGKRLGRIRRSFLTGTPVAASAAPSDTVNENYSPAELRRVTEASQIAIAMQRSIHDEEERRRKEEQSQNTQRVKQAATMKVIGEAETTS